MKIDQDYLKRLLEAFEASDQPTTNIENLEKLGFDYESDIFVFHMRLLDDQGLIEREDKEPGFGLYAGIGALSWSVLELRLTASGHEFLEAIRNNEVWATIKDSFKEASIGSLVSISKQLLESFVQKKIQNIL